VADANRLEVHLVYRVPVGRGFEIPYCTFFPVREARTSVAQVVRGGGRPECTRLVSQPPPLSVLWKAARRWAWGRVTALLRFAQGATRAPPRRSVGRTRKQQRRPTRAATATFQGRSRAHELATAHCRGEACRVPPRGMTALPTRSGQLLVRLGPAPSRGRRGSGYHTVSRHSRYCREWCRLRWGRFAFSSRSPRQGGRQGSLAHLVRGPRPEGHAVATVAVATGSCSEANQ